MASVWQCNFPTGAIVYLPNGQQGSIPGATDQTELNRLASGLGLLTGNASAFGPAVSFPFSSASILAVNGGTIAGGLQNAVNAGNVVIVSG